MQIGTLSRLAALFIIVIVSGTARAAEAPKSGNPVFDRAVQLVVDNFYDVSALDRFKEAVRREVEDPKSPVSKTSSDERVDQAIDAVLASLQASHTGHFTKDIIDYFELSDIFRYAIRDEIKRLFPPDG